MVHGSKSTVRSKRAFETLCLCVVMFSLACKHTNSRQGCNSAAGFWRQRQTRHVGIVTPHLVHSLLIQIWISGHLLKVSDLFRKFSVCPYWAPCACDAVMVAQSIFVALSVVILKVRGMKCTEASLPPTYSLFSPCLLYFSDCWRVDDSVENRTSCASRQPEHTGLPQPLRKNCHFIGASLMNVNSLQENVPRWLSSSSECVCKSLQRALPPNIEAYAYS